MAVFIRDPHREVLHAEQVPPKEDAPRVPAAVAADQNADTPRAANHLNPKRQR